MPRRIAKSELNGSTIDILNVIRQNAGTEYQNTVPAVTKTSDIPKVGEVIYGNPSIANRFLSELVNRIALVRINSAVFYNPYEILKKGYVEFGETIEEIFVGIASVLEYTPEKAEAREFKRYVPDVKTAFHMINWRVMYPVTIQDEDLYQAFMSMEGVQNLIANIVDQVYVAAAYDEFLLFKYLLIKAISHGKMGVQVISPTDTKANAVNFRGASNTMPFMSRDNNAAAVLTTTPRERQVIFMDAMYNAQFDVEVLAGAFNMDKADFMGRLFLIDNWASFDNDRFNFIRTNSDGLESVTSDELAVMTNIKAVLVDENWFQVYDNKNKFTEKYVASGIYWNYFYHVWKTVSYSPFSNAIAFAAQTAAVAPPQSITVEITGKTISEEATILILGASSDTVALTPDNVQFLQSSALTAAGIGVQPFGSVLIPAAKTSTSITLKAECGGDTYTATTTINAASAVGATVTLNSDTNPPTPPSGS